MSPEDLQTVTQLYQKCPHLWTEFRHIIDFTDLLTESPQAYEKLFGQLQTIASDIPILAKDERTSDLLRFHAAVGFVEHSVNWSRQIMRETGKTYSTELPDVSDDRSSFNVRCLALLRNNLLNSTWDSSEISVRLAKTGFLQDLVEDLKHLQHLTTKALVSIQRY